MLGAAPIFLIVEIMEGSLMREIEIYLNVICIFKAAKFKDIYPLSIQNNNSGIAAAAGIINSGDKKRGEKVKKEKEEPIRNLLSFATQTAIVTIVRYQSALIITEAIAAISTTSLTIY
ncbi:unnamed protein product [Brugia pahangi]|uniref:7TM_GPCR_Srx domain-containing protein n=1 Tax=Brugia pahangi TaxID=6280 RepID=A0A0N4T4N0_BRUPA|nr:unnamed protein product [Brugia pahangi]